MGRTDKRGAVLERSLLPELFNQKHGLHAFIDDSVAEFNQEELYYVALP